MSELNQIREWFLGYTRGRREGQFAQDEHIEQDFAFKHDDYVTGYWRGFSDGRRAKKELQ